MYVKRLIFPTRFKNKKSDQIIVQKALCVIFFQRLIFFGLESFSNLALYYPDK